FGPDAEFIVLGPDITTRVGDAEPATVARQTTLGFAQPLDSLPGSAYFHQTTFQKVDPNEALLVGGMPLGAGDIGQTRSAQTLGGYVAGIADVLHPATESAPATIQSHLLEGVPVSGDALPIQITL